MIVYDRTKVSSGEGANPTADALGVAYTFNDPMQT